MVSRMLFHWGYIYGINTGTIIGKYLILRSDEYNDVFLYSNPDQ